MKFQQRRVIQVFTPLPLPRADRQVDFPQGHVLTFCVNTDVAVVFTRAVVVAMVGGSLSLLKISNQRALKPNSSRMNPTPVSVPQKVRVIIAIKNNITVMLMLFNNNMTSYLMWLWVPIPKKGRFLILWMLE